MTRWSTPIKFPLLHPALLRKCQPGVAGMGRARAGPFYAVRCSVRSRRLRFRPSPANGSKRARGHWRYADVRSQPHSPFRSTDPFTGWSMPATSDDLA